MQQPYKLDFRNETPPRETELRIVNAEHFEELAGSFPLGVLEQNKLYTYDPDNRCIWLYKSAIASKLLLCVKEYHIAQDRYFAFVTATETPIELGFTPNWCVDYNRLQPIEQELFRSLIKQKLGVRKQFDEAEFFYFTVELDTVKDELYTFGFHLSSVRSNWDDDRPYHLFIALPDLGFPITLQMGEED